MLFGRTHAVRFFVRVVILKIHNRMKAIIKFLKQQLKIWHRPNAISKHTNYKLPTSKYTHRGSRLMVCEHMASVLKSYHGVFLPISYINVSLVLISRCRQDSSNVQMWILCKKSEVHWRDLKFQFVWVVSIAISTCHLYTIN